MNEWTATHRSRQGVQVMLTAPCGGYKMVLTKPGRLFIQVPSDQFDALFEPIPRPVMVAIPMAVAMGIKRNADAYINAGDLDVLGAAIEAAQKETDGS